MNTFVTSPESREHLRHSRYNVSREMVEADHAEANWLNNQPRDVVREQTVAFGGDTFKVRIDDQDQVWVLGSHWTRCGSIDWADVALAIAAANRLARAHLLNFFADMPESWANDAMRAEFAAIETTRDREMDRYGVNRWDVESQGYEALHLMRAEAVELDVFRDEVARHLSGAELDAAVLRYARDLEGRPRCAGCLYVDEHPVDCPFHPAVLEEARANVLARTSQDITPEGLDLYADYLRTKENSNA